MPEKPSLIAAIFPGLSPEELEEADEILRRYFAFIIRLHNRILEEEKERSLPLTDDERASRIGPGRTFTNQYDTSV